MKKDCSNILVYKEEMNRMCAYFDDGCIGCELNASDCNNVMKITPEYIEAVQKWSDEHPQKTLLIDLLEKYPSVVINNNGAPEVCVSRLYPYLGVECNGLCNECWNKPLEEE